MQKRTITKIIKTIIENYGTFNIGEIDGETYGICVNEMGSLVALIEGFNENDVEVNIYDPTGFSSDPIDTYNLKYEELSKDVLTEVLFIVEMYETDQEKTLKRCSN